ncbi:MAG: SUMF1/EgtB/PvdO family nonheme iron enzyme [Myxococcales bacterium]|nr:SUMF1/EgtB/PvdO family nonheme iron enzyme [Myxococcales bacterium]
MRPALLLLALLALPHPAVAAEKLAVLELHNPAGLDQQAADYLTDRIRAAALTTLGDRVRVLTRENLVALLPPGADLADCAGAACEVELGRRLGAGYVISGELLRFGPALKLNLKLHATADATLLAAEAASGDDVAALEAAVAPTTAALLAKLPAPAPAFAPAAIALPAVPPITAEVGPLAAVDFAAVDTDLLDRLQTAHRLDADPSARATDKAAAWRAVAGRAHGEQRDRARERARQWSARATAERQRAAAAREAWDRYRADRDKLARLLAYDDSVVSPAQKAAWQQAFDAAYAPWQADFARLEGGIDWVELEGGDFEWERSKERARVEPFAISRTEITQRQYRACVEAGACTPIDWHRCVAGAALATPVAERFGADDQPAVCVTYAQARAYARHAGGRLPTVTEWIHATRDGEIRGGYPWGDAPPSCDRVVFMNARSGYGCGRRTTWSVCERPRGNTRHGLCDMMGNAAEWASPPVADAPFPMRAARPVVVGGSIVHAQLNPARVDRPDPESGYAYIGFRVVRDAR